MYARSTPVPPSSGRYTIFGQIGAGGMATIQYAELVGPGGFCRPVAIKRLHPHLASDPSFASLFLDEARLSARIAHANVVATLDVLAEPEVAVVMEYVHGESLAGLLSLSRARATPLPYRVAANLLVGVLHGLHAAHETLGDQGEPLGIVHRDVSPENILVGSDGIARLLDFGIAKAKGRARVTPSGELKGKLSYMAPEQYHGEDIDRRVDVYGASVVLWETLTGRTLFGGASDAMIVRAVMDSEVLPPSQLAAGIPAQLDALVLRGLERDRDQRFASAREMALVLEREVGIATQSEVSDWLQEVAGELLQERAAALLQLRRRAEPRDAQQAGQAGTRRLAAASHASAGTRAQPLEAESGPKSDATRERERSGTRVRRSSTWLLGVSLVLLMSGAAWLASALHSPEPMPPESQAHAPDVSVTQRTPDVPAIPVAPVVGPRENTAETSSESAASGQGQGQGQGQDAASAGTRAREAKRGREPIRVAAPPERERSPRKHIDCSQPYDVDAQGIRRWKRECL